MPALILLLSEYLISAVSHKHVPGIIGKYVSKFTTCLANSIILWENQHISINYTKIRLPETQIDISPLYYYRIVISKKIFVDLLNVFAPFVFLRKTLLHIEIIYLRSIPRNVIDRFEKRKASRRRTYWKCTNDGIDQRSTKAADFYISVRKILSIDMG